MIDAGTYGAPNWVDLSTPDLEGAKRFYTSLFGWKLEQSTTPMGEYVIATHPTGQAAGMMQQGPELAGTPAVWTTFIFVEDVDETLRRVRDAGGAVLQTPITLPNGGRVAVAADPTGAMFGVITGERPQGVYLSREPGAVCWVEVLTRDPAAAEGFYAAVFDWKAETAPSEGPPYTMFMLGEDQVAGMMMMPAEVPSEAPAHWAVYFAVSDCEATAARVVELGGQTLGPATEFGMGRFAVLEDPQGAVFSVMDFAE